MTEGEATIDADAKVVANKKSASCDLEGETVLLNLETGIYHGLDGVGTRVWELVQEPRTVQAIRDALLAEYEVEPDVCLRDLLALLEQMRSAELIEVVGGPAA